MATYFDATEGSEDIATYLPEKYVTTRPTNLAAVASEAESDVIGRYTAPLRALSSAAWDLLAAVPVTSDAATTRVYTDLGDGTAVFLRGYTEDADDCTDAALVIALKRAIASAIVWKLGQEGRDLAASSQSTTASGARTWQAGHDAPLPKHVERFLARWDTREPCWGI